MNIFVVYGSKSDQGSYGPLCDNLKKAGHEVYFEVISAHRNPDHLLKTLKQRDYDVVVAGAGLAAALPGVVASKTNRPVFGVPVSSNFGGLDSLASMAQMPFGVSVMTCSPGGEDDIVNFLEGRALKEIKELKTINLVIDSAIQNVDYVEKELNRSFQFANENKIELIWSDEVREDLPNIVLVKSKDEVRKGSFALHTPILSPEQKNDPKKYLEVFEWVKEGGLWVGVNNTRNGIVSFLELYRQK